MYVGDKQHVSDDRLTILKPYQSDWNLHIKGVKFSDQGEYKCRIMTNPQQIKTLNVTVEGEILYKNIGYRKSRHAT